MQKYRCYYTNDFRDDYDAMAKQDDDGDWYRVDDVDARIAELEKALRFVLENELVYSSGGDRWRDSGCGCCSGSILVPPDVVVVLRSLMVGRSNG